MSGDKIPLEEMKARLKELRKELSDVLVNLKQKAGKETRVKVHTSVGVVLYDKDGNIKETRP